MTEPPVPPDPDKLDFSQFHPLDHHPWEPRCREFYGGWRNHVEMAWTFIYKDKLWSWFLCPVGIHRWRDWWKRNPANSKGPMIPAGTSCIACGDQKD